MLFTTAAFVCLYLPITLIAFFVIGRFSAQLAATWLFLASLIFYGVWKPIFVALLLASIVGNYWVGRRIAEAGTRSHRARGWLIFGIAANLVLLGYFKYANFLVDNVSEVLGLHWKVTAIALPIGISFFTFTQIAFLADSYFKGVREVNFNHYGLFVTYFPHLIAGPVLHHGQMMPQFRERGTYRFDGAMLSAGLAIFAIGLTKKLILADAVSPYADAIFDPVDAGAIPTLSESWLGALAYTGQIYFDFSGYSDMAIGLSLMFNIRLPFNFNSPYRATSISDFWRRWHISLSKFLRDYLYIALGGNRHGAVRRYANLGITMLLGGLWHGASWSFVIWGALHGIFLMLNHAWRALLKTNDEQSSRLGKFSGWFLTMLAVVVAWVFFRAKTLSGAATMLNGMVDLGGESLNRLLWQAGLHWHTGMSWCLALLLIAALAPNSNLVGQRLQGLCARSSAVRAMCAGAATACVLLLVLLNTTRSGASAFIYFNF